MIMYESLNMIKCGYTSCYVIKGGNGDVLVDTGLEEYRDHIETWLMNYNIRLIILTHGHAESIQNAAYFSKLYGAPIMISRRDMPLARDNLSRSYYITSPVGRLMKKRIDMNMHLSLNGFEPDIFAEEGLDLNPYGVDGVILNLEGHTKGSMGIYCKSSVGYDLYAGDAVWGAPIPMFPPICESPARAKKSIERIIALSPDRILCGGGNPIVCGSKAYKLFIDRF